MTTQLLGKNCDGGHYNCSPPKECCKQGCCYLLGTTVYRPPTIPSSTIFNPLFMGHWYFWLAVTATVAGILCVCTLWRKHSHGNLCCRNSGRDERASEPDSNGSCYAPPQYSRCNSFHQAPPPYSEVTSKPDLYPLVISYNGDHTVKNNNTSTGYLMVQYFKNFIVGPPGSLSATSTIDSLSSSFICNAANEANTIIPPPYSCTGSLEEVTSECRSSIQQPIEERSLSHSISGTITAVRQLSNSPSVHSNVTTLNNNNNIPSASITPAHSNRQSIVSIRDNPCFGQNATNLVNNTATTNVVTATVAGASNCNSDGSDGLETRPNLTVDIGDNNNNNNNNNSNSKLENKSQMNNCDGSIYQKVNNTITKKTQLLQKLVNNSQDSEDEHNFSDLLNLSLCAPSGGGLLNIGTPQSQFNHHLQEIQFSVTNSMTGSDISSLANLGTPDSPPRATSPTSVEMKELLDKIQKLPQQKSPSIPHHHQPSSSSSSSAQSRNYYHKTKSKTLYMPLYDNNNSSSITKTKTKLFSRGWLSRSAPNTPCTNFVPSFPVHKINSNSQRNNKTLLSDGSPLLKEHDESDSTINNDELL